MKIKIAIVLFLFINNAQAQIDESVLESIYTGLTESLTKGERLESFGCIIGNCENGKGVYVEKSSSGNSVGSIYYGGFVNGKKEGKGKCMFANGNTYEGNFLNGDISKQEQTIDVSDADFVYLNDNLLFFRNIRTHMGYTVDVNNLNINTFNPPSKRWELDGGYWRPTSDYYWMGSIVNNLKMYSLFKNNSIYFSDTYPENKYYSNYGVITGEYILPSNKQGYDEGMTRIISFFTKEKTNPHEKTIFEIEENGDIQLFDFVNVVSDGDKTKHELYYAVNVNLRHNNKEYILLKKYDYISKKDLSIKILNINAILDDYSSPKTLNYYQGIKSYKSSHEWELQELYLLSNRNILLRVKLTENYYRNDSRFNFPVPSGVYTQDILILINGENLDLVKTSKIPSCDRIIPIKSGGFFSVVDDGIAVYKYDNNLQYIWGKVYGEKTKANKDDYANCYFSYNNSLYIGGASYNKYHLGEKDPIIYQIDTKNGSIIDERIIKLKEYGHEVTGLYFDDIIEVIVTDEQTYLKK